MIGLKLEVKTWLSQKQRIRLEQGYRLELRLQLIHALRGEEYLLASKCPDCSAELEPIDIIRGFNKNPSDFTTGCPQCGKRFEPRVVCFDHGERIEFDLYCNAQMLATLPGKEHLSPEQFAREYPGIYRSAIVHHGSIHTAFATIGIAYEWSEERHGWENKIMSFLGELPDTVIARCSGVPVSRIRETRHRLGIARYMGNLSGV